MEILEKKIVLASKSPRRKQLLEQAGFSFTIRTQSIDEVYPANLPVAKVAPYLAEAKSSAALHLLESEDEILLTADSVVILNDQIYGKPGDRDEARAILGELAGNTHTVITGVCLRNRRQKRVFAGESKVTMESLSKKEIDYYVDRYQPFDKAGAYAIQEWIGLCKISRIEGTYANIMGLPVDLVYQELTFFP